MKRDNKFVVGSFTLSREHLDLSFLAGVDRWDLVEIRLENIEIELELEPNSLIVYFYWGNQDYEEYWYTEGDNTKFIVDFESKIYSFGKVNPINN